MEIGIGDNCRLDHDEAGVGWLYLDCRGAELNTLSLPVLHDVSRALDEVERREDLSGLIILSAKPTGFVASPSVEELSRLGETAHLEEYVRTGQSVMNRVAGLSLPTVALIHGHCLGSGLELALACRYRIANRTGSALGFPDVRLGVHPCHGGTARLPSLIGYWRAQELIRAGESVNAATAARLGLVDETAPAEALEAAARDLVTRDPGARRAGPAGFALRFRFVRRTLYKLIDYQLRRKPCPQKYVVSYTYLRLWRDHAGKPMPGRLAAERDSLLEVVRKPASRNLARTYLLQNRLRDEARSPDAVPPQRVDVFGAGSIGGGVAALLALHGWEVRLHDPDGEALRAAGERARRLCEHHLEDPGDAAAALAGLSAGAGDAIDGATLVIEAIGEDMQAKQALLSELEGKLGPEAVFATVTGRHALDELSLTVPDRLVGLHCFRPVERQPLMEIVAGRQSGERALATVQALVNGIQKLPLRVRNGPGFLVTRLQLPYMLQGAAMYERPRREVIEAAGVRFGMPFGPLELADATGLDVCQALAEQLGYAVPAALSDRVRAGELGQRTGKGFHDWSRGRRIQTGLPPGKHSFERLTRELIDPLLREAERCRDEQVVADSDLVDVAALFGVGFPAHTGGPLTLLREAGDDWMSSPALSTVF